MTTTSHTVFPNDPPKDENAWREYIEREAKIKNFVSSGDMIKSFSASNQCTNLPVKY